MSSYAVFSDCHWLHMCLSFMLLILLKFFPEIFILTFKVFIFLEADTCFIVQIWFNETLVLVFSHLRNFKQIQKIRSKALFSR